jgi:hypothetical protein
LGPGAGIASAVVSIGPEPDKLAIRRAAAHIVVDLGMLDIMVYHYVLLSVTRDGSKPESGYRMIYNG